MPAIPLPNQGSNDIMDAARADAVASLRNAGGQGPAYADAVGAHMPPTAAASMQGAASPPANAAPMPPADSPYTAEPPPDAVEMAPPENAVPHPAATSMPPAQSHGNGDLWSASNLHDFLRDEFQGSTKEVGYGVMRGLARVGQAGYTLGAGAAAAVADKVASVATGGGKTGAEDAVFDFKKNYIDPAIAAWTPQRQDVTGQGQGSGGAAQALGGAAEIAPVLATGGVGMGALLTSTGVNSATDSLDAGHSLRMSAGLAAVDTIGTALMANGLGGSLPLLKRALVQVPTGDVIAVAQDWIKKQILARNGHQDEADKINPLDNLGSDTVQNLVFAAMGGHKAPEAGATPPGGALPDGAKPFTDIPPGTPPLPPVVKPADAAPPPPATAAPPAPTVADKPTAEPMKDLRAQLRDMNDPATPRTGVFLSSANQANLSADLSKDAATIQRQVAQAQKTGRTVETPQGTLVLKDKATALKAQEQLKQGVDPQVIIGQATGAGDGKQTTDTAVVQGHTPDGAVAVEKTVAPAEVPAAVADVKAQGKEPVVTTIPEALQRREAAIAFDNHVATADPRWAEMPDDPTDPKWSTPEAMAMWNDRAQWNNKKDALEAAAQHEAKSNLAKQLTAGPKGESMADAYKRLQAAKNTPPPEAVDMPAAKPPEAAAPPEAEEGAESAQAGESEAPTAQRGIIKTGGGDRAVIIHDATPDAEGKISVSPIDEDGEPGPQIKVPAEALTSKTEKPQPAEPAGAIPEPSAKPETATPAAASNGRPPLIQGKDHAEDLYDAQVKADVAAAHANPDGKRPPLRQGVDHAAEIFDQKVKEDVAARPAAAKPEAPMDGLQKAVDQLVSQDVPPNGKKWLGKIPERAGNIAAFARALRAAAGSAKGEDAAHAIDMAKKAEQLDQKSPEAMAKNQGIGHKELDVHRENLLAAARKLIDPEFKRPEPLKVVQEKIKDRVAAKAAAPAVEKVSAPVESPQERRMRLAREKAAAPEPAKPAEKTRVIADVEDETKPKQLTKGEQLKIAAAGKRLIGASDADLDARTADVDKIIKEIYGPRLSDDERAAFVKSLSNERSERLRPKSREQEIDDEFADNHRMEDGEDDALEHRLLGKDEVAPEVAKLHDALEQSGLYDKLRAGAADGLQWKARKVLEAVANHTSGDLESFIQKIARSMPEETTFSPKDTVVSRSSGLEMPKRAGAYSLRHNDIQLRVRSGDAAMTHTLLHEAAHAATYHAMVNNPDHPAVRQATNLYNIFLNRMRAQHGDMIDAHINYLNNKGPKPADYYHDLYGMMNPAEHMAEMASNGKYREQIAKSERYKQEGEGFLGGVHNLAKATFNVLKKLLGMETSGEGSLLHSSMRNLENVMDAQEHMNNTESAAHDLHSLAMLDDDPKPLREEGRIRAMMGDATADTARQFYRSVKSGAVHALRRLVLANETHDQIVRSNSHWFGRDDETNPLRQWDSTKQDAVQMQNKILEHGRPAVLARQRLDRPESKALGQVQIDSQQWGFDPTKDKADQTSAAKKTTNFDARFDDFKRRYEGLSPAAREVFHMESDHNKWSARIMRKAGVDASLDTFSDKDITQAQRQLLYSAKTKGDFDSLIGQGKQIDVGDRNEDLKTTLQELSGGNQVGSHYFHLGRTGDYVVEVNPEVDRSFDTRAEAEAHAAQIREMGPNSKVKVAELGGKFQVTGKATYLSMHRSAHEAETEADRLRAQGHDVGPVTNKIESQSGGALTHGMQTLVAEAQRKLERRGSGPETQALTDALRGTFVQMVADRSAHAASKLARKGFGGVKPEEMGRNFAAHVQSSAWNIANLGTTFRQGEALGKLREAAKRPGADVSQETVYKRGAVVREIGKRTAQEVSQYGLKNPVNAVTAKLGYMNFLASPAHTLVNGTQNFTTGLPVGIAKWGAVKTIGGFAKATRLIAGPTFRSAMKAFKPGDFNTEDMVGHVIKAVGQDKEMGKWAPHLKQMLDRGALNSTFANEIGHQADDGNVTVNRAFAYARILPQMAEVYNRVSSALVALEATGGDVMKATDYVKAVHVDYSAPNKTRMSKVIAKVPGANTITMFRTYIQGMRHLLYSNVKNMVTAESKSRGEAAKTVAGLILAQSMVAGVVKGALIEPLRLAAYTYNQLFGDDDEYHDLDNTTRRFLADAFGNKAGDAVAGGLPHLLGFDLSSRMGLSDLFFHDMPDLLHADSKQMMEFVGNTLGGPIAQMVAEHKDAFAKAMDRGDVFGALSQIIPIKFVRDISQAMEIGSTGKQASNGGQLTAPSPLGAAYRAIGLKPADAETAQEKQGSIIQYKGFISDRKQRLISAYAKTDDKGAVLSAIAHFNQTNPANRIQSRDLMQQGKNAQRTMMDVQEGMDRDPNIRGLTNY